ncbi:hypothetical protein [Bacillus paralicheniformis]|uniref:hypothetical protein n=1 Tax=Bacillus paralicheniformis TaxID=1648923 RepID=UPI00128CD6A3|nr:hypothetical protein [Bacillus paralicheniformis]MPQ25092.1 hypothetical protein [Bacillus paralicheniformis]
MKNQLMVLNRLAGSADEMVNSIKETLDRFKEMNKEKQESQDTIEELRKEIRTLDLKKPQSESLLELVNNIERKQSYFSIPDFSHLAEAMERAQKINGIDALKKAAESISIAQISSMPTKEIK